MMNKREVRGKFWIVTVITLGISLASIASGTIPKNEKKSTKSAYVYNELIIKFQNDSKYINLIEEVVDDKRELKDLNLGVYLNALNKQYDLFEVTRVYPKVLSVEEITKKFPERAKRMPKGVSIPNLRPTYLFKFKNPDINMKRAALRFTKDPHIKYAQVNQIMKTTPIKE